MTSDRRTFLATLAGMTVGVGGRWQSDLRVDGARLNETLQYLTQFGATPDGGVSRVAYSDADRAGRDYARQLMGMADLEVSVDLAGNLTGRRSGRDASLPPITLGSHIDSVPEGGNYDGQVGSMAAIEVARTLADRGVHTRHPLEVVLFQNEEGGKTGSRAWSGEVEPAELDIVTASGKAIRDGIAFLGGDPDRLDDARRERGSVAAYLELHIEQGAVLERAGIPIGVVEGIVGIKRWSVTVTGFANHAGTTPMDQRRDALVAAADFTSRVYDHVRDRPGRQVATVGRIAAEPGAPNVIPGRVTLSLEVRDLSMETIDAVFAELEREARAIGRAREVEFAFERFYVSRAAPTDPRLRDIVEQSAAGLTLTTQRMPSGAGHDAQSVAQFAPVGMIFVPSRGGISHSPREYTSPEHVIHGANVLLRATMLADARNW